MTVVSQEARSFFNGHNTVFLSFEQFCIKTHIFLFFRPSHLHVVRHWASYFAFLSLSFLCKREYNIFSRLYKATHNEHSKNASFYNVMECKHYLPSVKTLRHIDAPVQSIPLALPLPCAID